MDVVGIASKEDAMCFPGWRGAVGYSYHELVVGVCDTAPGPHLWISNLSMHLDALINVFEGGGFALFSIKRRIELDLIKNVQWDGANDTPARKCSAIFGMNLDNLSG